MRDIAGKLHHLGDRRPGHRPSIAIDVRQILSEKAQVTRPEAFHPVADQAGSSALYDVGEFDLRMVVEGMVKLFLLKPTTREGIPKGGKYRLLPGPHFTVIRRRQLHVNKVSFSSIKSQDKDLLMTYISGNYYG